MKSVKLMILMAAAVCALAVSNVQAQIATNYVALTVTTYQQGPTATVTNAHATNTVFGPTSVKTYSPIKFIQEVLGPDIGVTNFTSAAKLAQTHEEWLVIDGTNVVNLSGKLTINLIYSETEIESGTQNETNSLSAPKLSTLSVGTLSYSDGTVSFTVSGLATGSTTDTVPNAGVYTETGKTTVMSMVGQGSNQTGSTIVTVKASVNSKVQLSL